MHIQSILTSKPHNPHYLARYVRFIESLQQQPTPALVERHHICPKAKDLFPEYSNLSKFPWNAISLTPRQHYIAHLLLWKAFGGSQTQAFWFLWHKLGVKSSKLYASAREAIALHWKGKVRGGVSKHSACSKKKISDNNARYWKGKKLSKDHISKSRCYGERNGMYGRTHSDDTKNRIKQHNIKYQYITPWGVFNSISELALNPYGVTGNSIRTLCQNKKKISQLTCKRLGLPITWADLLPSDVGFSIIRLKHP